MPTQRTLGTARPIDLAVADFLHALDRGDFGADPLHHGPPGDRAESAYVTALRDAIGVTRHGARDPDLAAVEPSRNFEPMQAA